MLRTSHYHIALLVTFLTLSGCSDKKAPLPPPAAANTAAQPPQIPTPAEVPQAAELMRAVFGTDYDASRQQATLTLSNPDDATERSPYAVMALDHTVLPDGEMLLLTNARLLDDKGNLFNPDYSMGSLSLYVLRKQDGEWKIIKRHENFDTDGSLGDTGTARWVQLGQGRTGLALVKSDMLDGFASEILTLYDVSHGKIRNLTKDGIAVYSDNSGVCKPRVLCWEVTGKWKLVTAPAGTVYPDLLIEFTGKEMDPVEGATEDTTPNITRTTKPIKTQARYRFDGTSYKLIEGNNPDDGYEKNLLV